jgi:uncharacterized protein with PIN domain
MGDHYLTIVPDKADKDKAKEIANKIVHYLIEKRIILFKKTNCILSKDLGYPPGENYSYIVDNAQDEFLNWQINGLGITINRQVFPSNWLDTIKCPSCNYNIIDTDWGNLLNEWNNKTENHIVNCPNCGQSNSIVDFVFEPTWGFGELGLTFWNWGDKFNDNFIEDVEKLIGHKLKIIYGRL